MKSMFDSTVRSEVMNRIDSLSAHSRPLWGEMTVAQMARHCAICEEYYHGNIKVNRSLLGRIVGRMALKGILKDEDSSLQRNAPTSPIFKVIESISDFEVERSQWKSLIERYGTFNKEE